MFATAKFSCLGLPLVKVLASSGDEALIEDRRGKRHWVRACELALDASGLCRLRTRLTEAKQVGSLAAVRLALASAPRPQRGRRRLVAEGVWLCEGALAADELAEVHQCAASCLVEGWGTVRRRTVGLPEGCRSPTMTHIRLTSQFDHRAPTALAVLTQLVLACADAPVLSVKQSDYLVYGPNDYAGWHDHAGESCLFIVALLFQSADCCGGNFQVKGLPPATCLLSAPGDVVICRSCTDHRVAPLRSGTRISINLDFWDLKGAPDRRSPHDLI